MTERFQERQFPLPIPDLFLNQTVRIEPLASREWIKENSLPPGISSQDPEVLSLLREGVKPCEIVIIRLGR